jgi:hypothetical protein
MPMDVHDARQIVGEDREGHLGSPEQPFRADGEHVAEDQHPDHEHLDRSKAATFASRRGLSTAMKHTTSGCFFNRSISVAAFGRVAAAKLCAYLAMSM